MNVTKTPSADTSVTLSSEELSDITPAWHPASREGAEPLPTIAIIGMGYVGLPLALQFARSGVKVIGLDIDRAKTDAINRGQSYIKHIPS